MQASFESVMVVIR